MAYGDGSGLNSGTYNYTPGLAYSSLKHDLRWIRELKRLEKVKEAEDDIQAKQDSAQTRQRLADVYNIGKNVAGGHSTVQEYKTLKSLKLLDGNPNPDEAISRYQYSDEYNDAGFIKRKLMHSSDRVEINPDSYKPYAENPMDDKVFKNTIGNKIDDSTQFLTDQKNEAQQLLGNREDQQLFEDNLQSDLDSMTSETMGEYDARTITGDSAPGSGYVSGRDFAGEENIALEFEEDMYGNIMGDSYDSNAIGDSYNPNAPSELEQFNIDLANQMQGDAELLRPDTPAVDSGMSEWADDPMPSMDMEAETGFTEIGEDWESPVPYDEIGAMGDVEYEEYLDDFFADSSDVTSTEAYTSADYLTIAQGAKGAYDLVTDFDLRDGAFNEIQSGANVVKGYNAAVGTTYGGKALPWVSAGLSAYETATTDWGAGHWSDGRGIHSWEDEAQGLMTTAGYTMIATGYLAPIGVGLVIVGEVWDFLEDSPILPWNW